MTSAAKVDIPVIDTEVAKCPRASQVMTLEKLPPGHEATKIIPNAIDGSTWRSRVTRNVIRGKRRNWLNKPIAGAIGVLSSNLKSDHFIDNDAPNISSAINKFSSKNESGSKFIVKESINTVGLVVDVLAVDVLAYTLQMSVSR